MGVDDSPSFRDLDDFFLQSQARIWLGEVLHTRFDEQISICDLLADGELLFEVSKALWNMLLIKYIELKSNRSCMFVPVDTRKSSGRYRPYSNVDSFLKVCKVMGLSGVDLFSPSDVVEKKDTRKVCVCIRSLSTKARAKQLNVPDFDIVTNTVPMPTDVVRCIRSSLELSSMSTVKEFCTYRKTRKQEDESYLEEEKNHFSDHSFMDFLYLESGESPDTVDKYALTQSIRYTDTTNRQIDKFAHKPGGDVFPYVNSEKHISVSDMISFRVLTSAPFNDSSCHSCSATESHSSDTTPDSSICRKLPNDVKTYPISRVLHFDFDAPNDVTTLQSSTYDKVQLSAHSWWDDTKPCCSEDQDDVTDNMQEDEACKGSNDKLADPKSIHLFNETRDCRAEDTSNAAHKEHDERTNSYMAPLLKTVAKGTALIGILFLLRLRNERGRKTFGKSTKFYWKSVDISDYLRTE
ncbi:hypothetical protein QVD17_19076 [Tagetes erecta]|uniref:Calponin-homology (CH) domain-containing protein n=1 Tax=Tagetes erecta TaxID=13708 RepID=A0AAD8NW80_TARER|nr:hypothetical protein QVD17_19076 [Tagetes erecta]